ncbi:U-box domain-containing protein 7-like [Cucurbita pepo subsp. pepo]|uniref:U-box domain-containing protein 7-like n=1 Tax=Cucurbita pepo subsp. pepo TaxID=3664 RepID=UPI000C9D2C5B|nr:U-box domain-containing protein 7-like [Cucurbita pepo subsp. pepo]XP_023524174.1 U-box domain-containing protein 7-like [Cucurbita pepo subsp. pepo]
MVKCERNNVGSVVFDRVSTSTAACGNFRLRTSFSAASFRKKIFDAVSCSGSFRYCYHHDGDGTVASAIKPASEIVNERKSVRPKRSNAKSEKLLDLLRLESLQESKQETEEEEEEDLEEFICVVKKLQDDDLVKRRAAASRVRLLAKEDAEARETFAILGAISPLIGMLDLEDNESKIASLYALLNLGIGNDMNKADIVKAGTVHKMLKLIESDNSINPCVSEAIVANFLGLSALDTNKLVIGSSGAIPFLVKNLYDPDKKGSSQVKQDALRALYNLSIFPSNVPFILETKLIPFLLNSMGDMEVSERALSILSNVVSIPEGREAISTFPDSFAIVIDVLNWGDSPGCQEKASYILMAMAHKSYRDRQAMIEAGISSTLLELTLLGSTLTQKRASRILQILRVDKEKEISDDYGWNSSAPICGGSSSFTNPILGSAEVEGLDDLVSEEKNAVKQLVLQSLQNNMRRIVRRANLPQDLVPSDHFKSLTSSSTSRSLPF